jgi:uncharacterized protein YndB with AHSA1/START domain
MSDTEFVIEPGRQDIVITRTFDAPRDVVFKAVTDPDLIPKWWGPRRYETVVDRAEVRPGGLWRFINRDADGTEYGFKGVYHDVVAPERIVQTFEFEGAPGHVALETMTLEERQSAWLSPSTSRSRPATPWSSPAWRRAHGRPGTGSRSSSRACADRPARDVRAPAE